MPLNVSAHAYGSAAQAALHDAVSRAKSADGNYDPLSPVTIVVPSSLAGYHVRRTLGRQARAASSMCRSSRCKPCWS